VTAIVVFAPMIAEAVIAARHDRRLRAAGAIEPGGDVYRWMQLAYPGAFFAMLLEGALRHRGADGSLYAGAALFVAAKGLKYWAIATLGNRWSFRVLVPPGSIRIRRGPYVWLSHPNYVAVAGELVAVAVAMRAAFSGPPATLIFVLLMWKRVRIEEESLGGE
jgi:methyltransferase